MGQGKEVKTRPDPKVEIQEKGEIFFFYRPKVDKDEAHGPDDVQRMYIVLRPESGDRAVEEKQAPDSGKEGRKHHQAGEGDQVAGASKDEGHEGGHGKEVCTRDITSIHPSAEQGHTTHVWLEHTIYDFVFAARGCTASIGNTGGEHREAAAAPFGGDGEEEPAGPGEAQPPVLGLRRARHHQRPGHQGSAQGRGVQHGDAGPAPAVGGARAGRGRVPHPEARARRPAAALPAHPPGVQAGAPRPRRRGHAAGGYERGARGVLPRAGQEPGSSLRRPGRRRRRRGRVPRAAEQAPRGVPCAPAGCVREPEVRAGGPAGPAQLRGVRAAAHRGVGRRRGGAWAGAGRRGGGRGGESGGRAGASCRVLGPGEDVRRGGRREAAAERDLGLSEACRRLTWCRLCAPTNFVIDQSSSGDGVCCSRNARKEMFN